MNWQILTFKGFTLIMLLCLNQGANAQTFPAPYCDISFVSNTEPITLVKFAGINSVTTQLAASTTPQLEDLTGLVGYVARGNSYEITIKGNTDGPYTSYITVFVDWNQDNNFNNTDELIQIGTISNSSGTDNIELTSVIVIPGWATFGSTRMRIIKNYNAYVTDACSSSGWGQAEDYTITVIDDSCEL